MSIDDSWVVFFVKGFFKFIFAFLILCGVIWLLFTYGADRYKQGQIDYANGVIKYEMIENTNVEQIWVEIEEE